MLGRILLSASACFLFFACGPSDSTGGGSQTPTCSADGDCADGFCGWNANNERVCKDYGDIGDSCGGYVVPDARTICEPGLVCYFPPNQNTDLPGSCVETCTTAWDTAECTDGFCAPTDNLGNVCKPWAQENDGCGGFVPAEWVVFCDPDLQCHTDNRNSPFIADMPGFCSAECDYDSDCIAEQYCKFDGVGSRCQYYTPAGVGCDLGATDRLCEPGTLCLPDSNGIPGYGTCQ